MQRGMFALTGAQAIDRMQRLALAACAEALQARYGPVQYETVIFSPVTTSSGSTNALECFMQNMLAKSMAWLRVTAPSSP